MAEARVQRRLAAIIAADVAGICVNRVVRDQVRDKLDFAFEDAGEPSKRARAPRLTFGQAGLPRLPLISRLFLASVLVATAAGAGIFFLMRSAGEKATPESSPAQEARAKASEATLSIGGLAMMPPAAGAAQSASGYHLTEESEKSF